MKKKKKITYESSIEEIFIYSYEYLCKSTENSIKFYEQQCKFTEQLINFHKEIEPFILFRKLHNEWEKELMELNKDYNNWTMKLLQSREELSKLCGAS